MQPAHTHPQSVPSHVAVIMDGNGRWAKARGLPRTAGHKKGADALRTVMNACRDQGVKYLTVYAFSSENWKRPPGEVSDLMSLLKLYLSRELKELHESGIRLRFIGDRTQLSQDIREMLQNGERLTESNTRFHFTVALSYGSRQELTRAARRMVVMASEGTLTPDAVTEDLFESLLDTHGIPEPDLLIRTGGEQRLSNFLLWQCAYTEFYFTPTLWPDFSTEHFAAAINEFSTRERRYGNAG